MKLSKNQKTGLAQFNVEEFIPLRRFPDDKQNKTVRCSTGMAATFVKHGFLEIKDAVFEKGRGKPYKFVYRLTESGQAKLAEPERVQLGSWLDLSLEEKRSAVLRVIGDIAGEYDFPLQDNSKKVDRTVAYSRGLAYALKGEYRCTGGVPGLKSICKGMEAAGLIRCRILPGGKLLAMRKVLAPMCPGGMLNCRTVTINPKDKFCRTCREMLPGGV